MKKRFELVVEFSLTKKFMEYSDTLDKAVGRASDKGAGLGFRDMEWFFNTKDDAEKAQARVDAFKNSIPNLISYINGFDEEE
jgi:hypothetical protein